MRAWLIIVFGFLFTIGNIVWDKIETPEPKFMYVPLAVFMFLLVCEVRWPKVQRTIVQNYFITYFVFLALGNIVKQMFYDDTMRQINDYVVGGLATLILLIFLIKWAIQRQANGGRA